ncbi:hypothetical protein PFDG_02126, partial [Plasmodium falciparum Dd2]
RPKQERKCLSENFRNYFSDNSKLIIPRHGTTILCVRKNNEVVYQLLRSCVELAKLWRTDRYLRHLEAVLIVADKDILLEVTGNGDVLEPSGNVLGTGSGGPYAMAAARALYDVENLSAKDIAYKAMNIAADMCCHTNNNFICETL